MHEKVRIAAVVASAATLLSLLSFSATAAPQPNDCGRAALQLTRTPDRVNVSCSGNLVSLSTPDGKAQSVHNVETHRSADVTGLSGAALKHKVEEISGSDEGPHPLENYIDSEYRGRTEDTVEYSTVENGEVIFESSVHLRTIISLQARRHPLEVTWWENNGREITFNVPVALYEDVPFAIDPEVGGLFYANPAPNSSFRETQTAQTPNRGGVYYWYPTNMTIVDQEYGVFELLNDIEAPHFLCFDAPQSSCRYPGGEEA